MRGAVRQHAHGCPERQNRKNIATARQKASRQRTFKSVSPETQVGLVGRRSEGAVLQPRCHDAGPSLVRQASEPGLFRMQSWPDTAGRP